MKISYVPVANFHEVVKNFTTPVLANLYSTSGISKHWGMQIMGTELEVNLKNYIVIFSPGMMTF